MSGVSAAGLAGAEDGGGKLAVQAGATGEDSPPARAPGQGGGPVRRGVHQARLQVCYPA